MTNIIVYQNILLFYHRPTPCVLTLALGGKLYLDRKRFKSNTWIEKFNFFLVHNLFFSYLIFCLSLSLVVIFFSHQTLLHLFTCGVCCQSCSQFVLYFSQQVSYLSSNLLSSFLFYPEVIGPVFVGKFISYLF